MPNGDPLSDMRLDVAKLKQELYQTRADAALVVHALNCALQWGEALFTFLPEGTPLHPNVSAAKGALDRAMAAVRGRQA
jgi:hypothetical protein